MNPAIDTQFLFSGLNGFVAGCLDCFTVEFKGNLLGHVRGPSAKAVAELDCPSGWVRSLPSEVRINPCCATQRPRKVPARPGRAKGPTRPTERRCLQCPKSHLKSSGKYFITHLSGFGAAWPSPQIEASAITCARSESKA